MNDLDPNVAFDNSYPVHHQVSPQQTPNSYGSMNVTDNTNQNDDFDKNTQGSNEAKHLVEHKTENEISCLNPVVPEAISPSWTFGFNQSVPLINLSDDQSNIVFYASAHLLVLFDIKNNRQKILRGHCNEVMSITCSGDKRWLASGDRGIDSAVIVWDIKTGEAVRTITKPHSYGVVSVALTKDARYLATLGADSVDQSLSIWNWTSGSDLPHCQVKISGELSFQTKITFNPDNYYHISTNGEHQVIFYSWSNQEKDIVAYAPSLKDDDFKQKVGQFSCTQYIPDKFIAITGTSTGLLVIWESDKQPVKVALIYYDLNHLILSGDNYETPYKRATKLIPLHEKGITFLTTTACHPYGKCIVTGDSSGQVKFFDCSFMLLFWYQDLKFGPVNCISFATTSLLTEYLFIVCNLLQFILDKNIAALSCRKNQSSLTESIKGKDYPTCATIGAEPFIIEDFIVSTSSAVMISVTVEGGFKKVFLIEHDSDVNALTTHPVLNHIATCSYSGLIKVYDYESKLVITMKSFGLNNPIQSCVYDKTGQYLAVGFMSGYLRVLDSLTLNEMTPEPFTYGKGPITHIDFSYCNNYCAYADSAFTTTLLLRSNSQECENSWCYVARVRAHNRRITDLLFWTLTESKRSRLFTLSEDRTLAEYDLYNARKHSLPVIARYQVEQLAKPLCLSMLPLSCYKEEFFFISNSASKIKLYNTSTLMCRKTVSSFPQGIQYTKVLPLISQTNNSSYFMVCLSKERLGLIMLPFDGDPLKYTNIIAHPSNGRGVGQAQGLAIDRKGLYAFTAGGPDTCVHMWTLNPRILEITVNIAGCMKRRFYDFLSPDFLEEMKDYFYYSMIRTQGIRCMDERKTSFTIPITGIPFVMRAIGFYPTEAEVENMINEIKYSKFCETGEYTTEIDLDTFIQCEAIGEAEMSEYMAILWGILPEGDHQEMLEQIDPEKIKKELESRMSKPINAETFVSDILQMYVYGEDKLSVSHSEEPLSGKIEKTNTSLPNDLASNEKYIANSTQTE
ncbi:putative wd-repeat protein [Schistosoma mansoni]|uniref:putative wd-repeat protein n=1 Tax=Schistosoma mansoni TaxID=6183 RepID=UPI00022DCA20|nr:putative wd-repeat protein [Schistosoma mansoni]|eukprot:XP_018655297.1 putative wd-repeat protein [Schistosoma mansoni]